MERGKKGITKETEQTSLQRNSKAQICKSNWQGGEKLSVRKRKGGTKDDQTAREEKKSRSGMPI